MIFASPTSTLSRRSNEAEHVDMKAGGFTPTAGVVAAFVLLAGCREHQGAPEPVAQHGSTGSASAAATTRVLYPNGPGGFVDLVAAARHGVVAIRSATPV